MARFVVCLLSVLVAAALAQTPTPTETIGGAPPIITIPPTPVYSEPPPPNPYAPLSALAFYVIVGVACVLLCVLGMVLFFTYQSGTCCFKRKKKNRYDSEPMAMNTASSRSDDPSTTGPYVPLGSSSPSLAPQPSYSAPPPQPTYSTQPSYAQQQPSYAQPQNTYAQEPHYASSPSQQQLPPPPMRTNTLPPPPPPNAAYMSAQSRSSYDYEQPQHGQW